MAPKDDTDLPEALRGDDVSWLNSGGRGNRAFPSYHRRGTFEFFAADAHDRVVYLDGVGGEIVIERRQTPVGRVAEAGKIRLNEQHTENISINEHLVAQLVDVQRPDLREQRRVNHARKAAKTLDVWATLLPARIVNEELGDYLEDINRRAIAGQRFLPYLRMVAAMFWTSVNAVGYYLKEVGKTKSA